MIQVWRSPKEPIPEYTNILVATTQGSIFAGKIISMSDDDQSWYGRSNPAYRMFTVGHNMYLHMEDIKYWMPLPEHPDRAQVTTTSYGG